MNLYEELELTNLCTEDDIKKQYRRLASLHHPDKGGDEEKFKRLKLAYEILSNPFKRSEYDSTGRTHEEINIRSDAIQQLSFILNHVINNCDPSTVDYIQALKFEINQQIDDSLRKSLQASKSIIKLNTALKKLVLLKDSENVMESLILNLIQTKNGDIEVFKHRIRVCHDMLKILKDYSYGFLAITELR